MDENKGKEASHKGLRSFLDNIEGDKVIWIVALLLIVISVLVIFSSTPLMRDKSRMDAMTEHLFIAIFGLGLIFFLYKFVTRIGIYRFFSQFGFLVSIVLLTILNGHGKLDIGPLKAAEYNDAYRILELFGYQIHVFEVVKVAMVMYLAWALHAMKQDKEAMENGQESPTFRIANSLSRYKHLGFMKAPLAKRAFYIYLPAMIVSAMIIPGSNSSAIFIAAILIGTMFIGGIPVKELLGPGAGLLLIGLICFGIYKGSDGTKMKRMGTLVSRVNAVNDTEILRQYKKGTVEFYDALGKIRQPYGAKIAVHEGKLTGKMIGNSTQKYYVPLIYSDYMFSFIIEEFGLIGGIIIMLLYLSLIARCSTIISLCSNEFAKTAIGGLAFLITGQAFLHILVNADIIPMTGQTLPLLSDGASAFLMFCLAFGIILSISKMANKKMKKVEEAQLTSIDDIRETITQLEQIDDEQHL